MIVKIFTLKKGLRKLEDVSAIRIKSKDYNLLILKDYIAIMGRITGEFSIEVNDDIIGIGKIRNNLLKREVIY